MQKHLYTEWARLIGAPVEIRRNGVLVRSGVVQEVMPDSSALWIRAEGPHGRELFLAADNYEVWIELDLLDGEQRYRMTRGQLQ